MHPIDGQITFPPIDPNRVFQPHQDILILTLGINDFNVRRIFVDMGSSVDLLQMVTFKQIGFSLSALENPGQILPGFNEALTTSLGDIVLPIQVSLVILVQCHHGAHMVAWHGSHSLYLPPNGELPNRRGTNQSLWKPVGNTSVLSSGMRSQIQQ